ncbi:MAG: Ribosome-binding ATPase YchF [Syntrophorhabdus sp. PtaU1.Bin153]|nr:MAG: Ribosome-binding ATPase YchF [Syntrophorhabdus sp. PtaU1.Bin153]
MYISIIGKAGSGKTTLFQALSGGVAPGGGSGGIVSIDVPDERLDYLTGVFQPKKTVYARIELSDTAAIDEGDLKNETMNQKSLQQMRLSDAFLLLLAKFDTGLPMDPLADFRTIFTEFILSDMAQVESRLERMEKQYGKKDNPAIQQEKVLLEQCLGHLNAEKPLSTLIVSEADDKRLRGFQFLSRKPMMVVVNCAEAESASGETIIMGLQGRLPENIPVLAVCAKLEAELALMPEEERTVFMEEYGIKETIRGRVIRLAVDTLGLISFLTVGEDECRAWPIKKGTNAQDAAGTIHTDLAHKFIRAETVAYEAFVRHGGKKAGVWRLEGKTYIVQDGDILCIRAGN